MFRKIKLGVSSVYDGLIAGVHGACLTLMLLGPFVVLGGQVLYWLKFGKWLPLPIEIVGLTSLKGIAQLPLSLGVFVTGMLATLLTASLCPEKGTKSYIDFGAMVFLLSYITTLIIFIVGIWLLTREYIALHILMNLDS